MGVSTESEPRRGTRDHGFHPLRVRRVVSETPEAISLVLDVPGELTEAFGYSAGQFVTFRVTIDDHQHLRSYSMSSSPEVDDELAVTVKRVAGGLVSNWIADAITAGDILESTRPAGVFCLGSGSGDVLAYAGGSGITPVYSLAKTTLATTTRRVRLLYANRDRESTIFAAELDALAEHHPGRLEIVHHWDAERGFVAPETIRRHAAAAPASEVFICGPGPFMDLVETALHGPGIEAGRIHIERFTPADLDPEPPAEAPSGTATQVEIELDGKVQTTTHRAGTTILQTARQMGMTPPSSCEAGDCATCMGRLVSGTAAMHANNALTDDEVAEGWILTCQAVPDPPAVRVRYGYDD
ncbi:MAG TPA: ferredoxin--NADP reductase [Frankiaceae bacterium]|jgi:ferredoxin-NADP reductase|nr:ferredoxin--NADP reductase [Frankiaceae bacterium]